MRLRLDVGEWEAGGTIEIVLNDGRRIPATFIHGTLEVDVQDLGARASDLVRNCVVQMEHGPRLPEAQVVDALPPTTALRERGA